MKISDSNLFTPVYLKTEKSFTWPKEETVFHLLTSDGLFLCRNHPFFRSSAQVSSGPSELDGHRPFIKLNYPKIPRQMFERAIGFFDRVGSEHGAESAVLFGWNRKTEKVQMIVPPQRALVGEGYNGEPFPINVWYDLPPLPDELIIFGDAHCHVEGPAYASKTDMDDDAERPGLHIIVGCIDQEPPEIQVDVTVDQSRFHVKNPSAVIEGYHRRRCEEIPNQWMDCVEIVPWKNNYSDPSEK